MSNRYESINWKKDDWEAHNRLKHAAIQRIIEEFMEDLKGINYQMTVKKVKYINIDGTIEKWEAKK